MYNKAPTTGARDRGLLLQVHTNELKTLFDDENILLTKVINMVRRYLFTHQIKFIGSFNSHS